MMHTIKITGGEGRHHNPLLALDGQEYANWADACEAIYDRLYDVITGEHGCEMVERTGVDDAVYYIARIRSYYDGNPELAGVTIINAGPITYGDAYDEIQRLNDELYYTLNGEAGRPEYYIIDKRVYKWLDCDDGGKYGDPPHTDNLLDVQRYMWERKVDEDIVTRKALAIEKDADIAIHNHYITRCKDYILAFGYATEDGVTARVEEVSRR